MPWSRALGFKGRTQRAQQTRKTKKRGKPYSRSPLNEKSSAGYELTRQKRLCSRR